MKRDWAEAHRKLDAEGHRCCVCKQGPVDPAHLIPRSRVGPPHGEDARNIVPLCRAHHRLFDANELDLLPYLTKVEQSYAVLLVGIEEARRRLTGER